MTAELTDGAVRGRRKVRVGTVVSSSMDKTISVLTKQLMKHARYGKFVNRTKRFLAQDDENACRVGDRVRIVETRPLSKRKHWRLDEIVERAK